MIYDSEYWKDDLLERAAYLRRLKYRRAWGERTYARFEQCIMLGFYSIRKLAESLKLSDSTVMQQLTITSYPCLGKDVTWRNRDYYWELYDLESPRVETRGVLFLCHQVVHSYVFCPFADEQDRLQSILVASDRQRHRSVLELKINQIIALFKPVGGDYPHFTRVTYNEAKRDYDVVST